MEYTAQGHKLIGQQGWDSESKAQGYDRDMSGMVLLRGGKVAGDHLAHAAIDEGKKAKRAM